MKNKLKEIIQGCCSGGVVKSWRFMPGLIKAIMEWHDQEMQRVIDENFKLRAISCNYSGKVKQLEQEFKEYIAKWKYQQADVDQISDSYEDRIKQLEQQIKEKDENKTVLGYNVIYGDKIKESREVSDCLKEAIDLMEDVRTGDYKPDTLTTQPWTNAIKSLINGDKQGE